MSEYTAFIKVLEDQLKSKYPEHTEILGILDNLSSKVIAVEEEIEIELQKMHKKICKKEFTVFCESSFISKMHDSVLALALAKELDKELAKKVLS